MTTTRKSAGKRAPTKSEAGLTQIERRRRAAREDGGVSFHARRDELLAVAAQVFREKGMSRSSLGEIAERAKVDRATIYYYFSSKEDLFKHLIERVVTRNVEEVEAIAQRPVPSVDKLRLVIEALLVSFATHNPYAAVYVEEFLSRDRAGGAADGLEHVRELGQRYDRAVRGVIREGMDAGIIREIGDERTIASMIIGLMNSSVRWQRTTSVQAARKTAAIMTDLILGGLETPGLGKKSETRST